MAEVIEISEQLERMTIEGANNHKTIKCMSVSVSELNIKVEELSRTIVDITSSKQRLSVVRNGWCFKWCFQVMF